MYSFEQLREFLLSAAQQLNRASSARQLAADEAAAAHTEAGMHEREHRCNGCASLSVAYARALDRLYAVACRAETEAEEALQKAAQALTDKR